ncbi:MAG TPA: DUF6677 family protein [Thermoanaerobaculia bacterium]|nr:DUF6677 family protein [Thermoanaerobaculia bacterium]
MNVRAVVAMVLALLVPGAGHFYLGRRKRAAAFLVIVTLLFVIGLAVGGSLYVLAESRDSLLHTLASLGSMGSGLFYFLGRTVGPPGDVSAMTFEYGRMFTLSAGLMNLLLVIDCYDLAVRGKL